MLLNPAVQILKNASGLSDNALAAHFRSILMERRRHVLGQLSQGLTIHAAVLDLTTLADEIIQGLSRVIVRKMDQRGRHWDPEGCALVALGGYGRRELFPFSDIDLMVLHQPGSRLSAASYARSVFQYLWDLGFQVGHSVRTPGDCLEIGRNDLDTRTTLMEARLLYGNEALYRDFRKKFWSRVGQKRVDQFIRAKVIDRREEYMRFGSTVYLLEPDIKRSRGGLRDLHLVRWIAKVHQVQDELADLYQKGLMSEKDYLVLQQAQDFLWKIRMALHGHAGRCQDVLSFHEQLRLAVRLGYQDDSSLLGVEKFMRDYYRHTSAISEITARFITRFLPRNPWQKLVQAATNRSVEGAFRVNHYEIRVAEGHEQEVLENPLLLFKLFRLSQQHRVSVSRKTRALLYEKVDGLPGERWEQPAVYQCFIEILSGPGRISKVLKMLNELNLLKKVIPEYQHVHHLMQFNQVHKYTIDEHCIRAVGVAESLIQEEGVLSAVYQGLKHRYLLHLALLLHDIGKGRDGDHSQIGEQIAHSVAERLSLETDQRSLLAFLVREHLLMANTAFRRDLSDEAVILSFARQVAHPEALKMLYVLTYADISAVGPTMWTPWKQGLLHELFIRTLEILSGTREALTKDQRNERVLNEIRKAVGSVYPPEWLEPQLQSMSSRYLLATPSEKIARQLEKIRLLAGKKIIAEAGYHPVHKTSEYTVYTYDDLTPGIFYKIAGVLAAKGLQILDAQIHTLGGGVVVDAFQVMDSDYTGRPPRERYRDVSATIEKVLRDEVNLDDLFVLGERVFSGQGIPPRLEPTRVEIDNLMSERYTIIDVFAHDRQGLLYVLTQTIFELGLSFHYAKVATRLDQVVDVFYVTDQIGGNKVREEDLGKIREILKMKIDDFLQGSVHQDMKIGS